MEKQKILSKLNIKDYKNDLETILEMKKFDEEAKSLLLNILYKLDNFYKDYVSVKVECEPKNEYIEDYIKLIKEKCNRIIIVKPQEWKGEQRYKVNINAGEVQCIPNEDILFYAIYELDERNVNKGNNILKDFTNICVNYTLNKGRAMNSIEPIRDFNGWSWNVQIDNREDIYYNLIFQNLLLLCGYNFMESCTGKLDIVNVLHDKMISSGFENEEYAFLSAVFRACIVLYSNVSKENNEKCVKYKNSLKSKIKMLNSRKENAENKYKNSSDVSKQIKKIDEMMNDIAILKQEYIGAIQKDADSYLGLSDFVEKKELERTELLGVIKENNKSLSIKKYMTEEEEYEQILKLYNSVDGTKNNDAKDELVKLQVIFLECIEKVIRKHDTKKELCGIIKKLRYFANLLIDKDEYTVSNELIRKKYEEVTRKLTYKMLDCGVIDTGFVSKELNYDILKYIFKTKMIELENLIIRIVFLDGNHIEVEYYDSDIAEYKEKFDIPDGENVTNKKDKKIKLFKIGG